MKAVDIPVRFPFPFANFAGAGFIRAIPDVSQIGIQGGAASLTDGFPPVCFDPVGAGGIPPFGQDFNGILFQITAWARWQGAAGPVPYNAAFATAIGGYPSGAILQSSGTIGYFWINTIDDNSADPDFGGANWVSFSVFGGTTGDFKWRPTAENLLSQGWIPSNAKTVGNASSNATNVAGALTAALFSWLWLNFSNTECPVYTSGGVPSTRGASAAADYAANKAIATPDMRCTGIGGVDGMGNSNVALYAGVPVALGSVTAPGSYIGENLHVLVLAELAAHTHPATGLTVSGGLSPVSTFLSGGTQQGNLAGGGAISGVATVAATAVTWSGSVAGSTAANTGGGSGHNTVQRIMLGTWYIRL